MDFLKIYEDKIYAMFRIVAGLLLAQHGFQKLLGWFGGVPAGAMPAPMLYGLGTLELVLPILVIIGLFTVPASFFLSGLMAGAFLLGHVMRDPNYSIIPIINRGELAALYSWVFLLIATKGAGIWSFDSWRRK